MHSLQTTIDSSHHHLLDKQQLITKTTVKHTQEIPAQSKSNQFIRRTAREKYINRKRKNGNSQASVQRKRARVCQRILIENNKKKF